MKSGESVTGINPKNKVEQNERKKKKMRKFLIVLMLLLMTFACGAAEDEMDISEQQKKVQELGIPTTASVEELKNLADNLYASGEYEGAAQVYNKYSQQANWLANIISTCLEPYYGASYDDRKDWRITNKKMTVSLLAPFEEKANGYKYERNRAVLYEGMCYYKMNDYSRALPMLLKALDILDHSQEDDWKLAMGTVCSMVGVPFTL